MNPETQQNQIEMTPDEAAASLSFATQLSEGMAPKADPEGPEMAQPEPQMPAEDQKADIQAMVDEAVKNAVQPLIDQINDLISEDEHEEEQA